MRPDFNRDVYCILGLPFDAIDLATAVQRIESAAANRSTLFFSTPNLNFLIGCQTDNQFRDSVINSDLSFADGMPLVWIAHLLCIPVMERVAGSDLFDQLRKGASTRLSVYFFGGLKGIAEKTCQILNATPSGLVCAGFEFPGFSTVQEMSSDKSIEKINASSADFLVVSLGAKKGQAWIEYNRARISVPVISHLGAVINFVAGSVDRAPVWMRRTGLEWVWRIKEEPGLWRRYTFDGLMLLKLLFTCVVPYAWLMCWHKIPTQELDSAAIQLFVDDGVITIRLQGAWVRNNLMPLRECFSSPTITGKDIRIELEHVTYVDHAFIGLLLLMHGYLGRQGKRLSVNNLNKKVRRIFRYSCVEYLLDMR